jgi:SAM-dependent methyltransferase
MATPSIDAWPEDDLEEQAVCPFCGESRRDAAYGALRDRIYGNAPGTWRYWRCAQCRALYLDPRPTAATIGRAYMSYYTHASTARTEPQDTWSRLRRGYVNARFGYELAPESRWGRWVVPLIAHRRAFVDRNIRHLHLTGSRALLDVGCGGGAFVQDMQAMGWSPLGIDVDRAAVEAGSAAGLPVRIAELSDLLEDGASFDAITLSHVIEHLHHPPAELERARRLLKPGGTLWIATPNARGLAHRVFDKDWVGLDPPRHLTVPTRAAIAAALRTAGFQEWAFPTSSPAFATPLAWMSTALERGEDPLAGVAPTDRRGRLRIKMLEWLPLLRPSLNDEVVVIARDGSG